MIQPELKKLADECDNISVAKVNVDENMELASAYQIMSIPSIILFNKGQVVKAKVGLQSKNDLQAMLNL